MPCDAVSLLYSPLLVASGGFRVILPNRNASKAKATLAWMEKGHYIDLQTRLITVEFNT